ncbi:MAG: hypothetical protein NT121_04280 [Chloroflexi bacterium]|nr:hypothetical protein [Chloroflexota bacterium]
MKTLMTKEFVKTFNELSPRETAFAIRRIEILSEFGENIDQLLDTEWIKVLADTDGGRIYELRINSVRMYFTVEKVKGSQTIIFIGLERKNTNKSKLPAIISTMKKKGSGGISG